MEVVGFARKNHNLNFGVRVSSLVVLFLTEVFHADAAGHIHAVKQKILPWLVLV